MRPICCLLTASLAAMAASAGQAQEPVQRYALGGADTVSVSVSGDGPAVLIVPGLLGSRFSFRHVVPALAAAGLRVIIVDPLGTGTSSRPKDGDYSLEAQARRIVQVMDSVAVREATLLCHSVGASICYRLALHAPDRVSGIVAVNGGPDEHAATNGLRRALRLAPLIRILGSGSLRGRLRDGLVDSSHDPSWVTEEVVEAYTQPFRDLGSALRGWRGMAAAAEPQPLAPRLSSLRPPVLLLLGSTPRAISPAALATLEQNVPRLRVQRVASAGQYIQEENPAAVVQAVTALRADVAAGVAIVPRPDSQR